MAHQNAICKCWSRGPNGRISRFGNCLPIGLRSSRGGTLNKKFVDPARENLNCDSLLGPVKAGFALD